MDRYFIRGLIDGSLSTLGIVIGASVVIGMSADASRVIIAAGIGGGVANGLSNILGALTAEKAVTYKELEKLEKAMLKRGALGHTKMFERWRERIVPSGIADGLATIGGSAVPVIPFLVLPALTALKCSVAATLLLLFILGMWIGRISKENLVFAGLKMAVLGGATAGICALIKIVI